MALRNHELEIIYELEDAFIGLLDALVPSRGFAPSRVKLLQDRVMNEFCYFETLWKVTHYLGLAKDEDYEIVVLVVNVWRMLCRYNAIRLNAANNDYLLNMLPFECVLPGMEEVNQFEKIAAQLEWCENGLSIIIGIKVDIEESKRLERQRQACNPQSL